MPIIVGNEHTVVEVGAHLCLVRAMFVALRHVGRIILLGGIVLQEPARVRRVLELRTDAADPWQGLYEVSMVAYHPRLNNHHITLPTLRTFWNDEMIYG